MIAFMKNFVAWKTELGLLNESYGPCQGDDLDGSRLVSARTGV